MNFLFAKPFNITYKAGAGIKGFKNDFFPGIAAIGGSLAAKLAVCKGPGLKGIICDGEAKCPGGFCICGSNPPALTG